MITLTTGQKLLTDPEWEVLEGGDFEPDALVTVYRVADPIQQVAYYAQFIATGEYPQ